MEYVQDAIKKVKEASKEELAVGVGAAAAVGLGLYALNKAANTPPTKGPYQVGTLPADCFDAVIVGAGPSGSTCGHYLAKSGARVALLDKETFPRDKYCGDAVCTPAIRILQDMGVLQELIDNNEAHFADSGGFVSPSGLCYIGASKKKLGQAAACAVKRINLDNRIAKCAQRTGANLMEQFEVVDAQFDKAAGLWTVFAKDGRKVRGRCLVCADGATSRLATKLGYCTAAPEGVCTRAFVKGGTHNTNFDGVCFYPRESLPGYAAIFKHPNDELNFCYYLIPTGKNGQCGNVKESDLARLHNEALTKDPFISKALGDKFEIERMRAASLRLGGQGLRTTFDDHLIIVGDAAGHIDPLTGEGIHTAIMGGKAAAETILDMRRTGDFSRRSTRMFEKRWMDLFGYDFPASKLMAQIVYRFPILLDATAREMEKKGDEMMSKWAEVMTNMRPKSYFLDPRVAIPLGWSTFQEFFEQYILRRPDFYPMGGRPANSRWSN